MPHIFTSSKGHIVNLDAKRSLPHPEALEELKQHPELYEKHMERNRKWMRDKMRERRTDKVIGEIVRAKASAYRKTERGKQSVREYQQRYRAKNKNARIAENIRSRIYTAMFNNNCLPAAERFLGCTIPEYKAYLESKFLEGMSWSNRGHGIGKWCIDHVRPVSFYDLTDPEQLKQCFHYLNTQPIWFRENIAKWYSDKPNMAGRKAYSGLTEPKPSPSSTSPSP